MKSKRMRKNNEEEALQVPFLGKILPYWNLLIFLILSFLLISEKGTAQIMSIVGFVGMFPGAILYMTQKKFLREEKVGRRIMHHAICYLMTIITVFFYTIALYRSDQLVLLSRILIVPGSALVYYSLFMNLQGKGRTDMRKRNARK